MSRSKWKGKFICFSVLKKYLYLKNKYKELIIYKRNSTILKEFLGTHYKIYNGKRFFNIFITEDLIGHKFGEFSYTRKLSKNIHYKKK